MGDAKFHSIYESRQDGSRGGCVFDSMANSVEDACSQVAGQSWPFGFWVRDPDGGMHQFPGNDPKRAAYLRGES